MIYKFLPFFWKAINMVINTQKQKAFILFDLVIPILELFRSIIKKERAGTIKCRMMFTAANSGRTFKCLQIKEPVDIPLSGNDNAFTKFNLKAINYSLYLSYEPKYQIPNHT